MPRGWHSDKTTRGREGSSDVSITSSPYLSPVSWRRLRCCLLTVMYADPLACLSSLCIRNQICGLLAWPRARVIIKWCDHRGWSELAAEPIAVPSRELGCFASPPPSFHKSIRHPLDTRGATGATLLFSTSHCFSRSLFFFRGIARGDNCGRHRNP